MIYGQAWLFPPPSNLLQGLAPAYRPGDRWSNFPGVQTAPFEQYEPTGPVLAATGLTQGFPIWKVGKSQHGVEELPLTSPSQTCTEHQLVSGNTVQSTWNTGKCRTQRKCWKPAQIRVQDSIWGSRQHVLERGVNAKCPDGARGRTEAAGWGRGVKKGITSGNSDRTSGFPKPYRWRRAGDTCDPDLQLTVA